MTRVLYISYDGMTDNLGQSQVIPYLKGLSEHGYSFTILSCEKQDNYAKNESLIRALLSESNINWEPIKYHKSPPVLSTVYDLYLLRSKATQLYKKNNFDVIHCRSYLPSLVGLNLKKRYNVKFIFDMRGFWADERVDGNLWNLKNPIYKIIYRFFKRKELEFIENSDAIISLTENGKSEMETWRISDSSKSKISVIPCCVDTVLFSRSRVSEEALKKLRSSLKLTSEDFVLSYLGSIGTWYMLSEMCDFFSSLLKKKKNAKFLFISPEKEHKYIAQIISQKNINPKNVIITESQRTEVAQYISLSNFSLFFIKPSYSKKSSFPTKQAEIMAMGVPLICNGNVGDVEDIVKRSDAGFVVQAFNKDDYGRIINRMDSITFDAEKVVNDTKSQYSLDRGVELYADVYGKMLND